MNNDRFKFRVWDKENEIYIQNDANQCYIEPSGKLDCYFCRDDDYCDYIDSVDVADVIIEQCTGLKDKNGKLIFEGDIVRCKFEYKKDESRTWNAVVEWDKFNPCFVLKGIEDEYNIEYDFVKCGLIDLEIVGNIHEVTK